MEKAQSLVKKTDSARGGVTYGFQFLSILPENETQMKISGGDSAKNMMRKKVKRPIV